MALDQFKTQVLLLHSEQSALDNLSSGFNDRYTVHCATSGTEALNFLGDTPIHVIISAQNLPGMSGAEALREAKKRSPETVGILLAGDGDTTKEAMVGDEEVFEVVRGNVEPDGLLKLIENATQKMRLMALAESANDTAANVEETVTEHIVMETSENGATIISDGTGQLPALDPDKVSAAASVGARAVDLLVLTQDEEFLKTVRDSARGMHNVYTANTLAQADEAVSKNKIGVAIVDAAMVGGNVEKLTLHLRKNAARLVSIVAGRRDDGEMLMDLINRGKVYRFLLKPVSPGRARLAIEASIKHHLEAPDSAFRLPATAEPAPKPAPKPEPAAKAAPEKNKKQKPAGGGKKEEKKKVEPTIARVSPIDSTLDDAFSSEDTSFTETMTGIVTSVGKSISGIRNSRGDDDKEPSDVGAVADGSGGSLFANPKIIGIGVAAVAIVAAGIFWAMSGSDEPAPTRQQPVAESPSSEPEAQEPAPRAEPAPVETTTAVTAMLDEARLARDAGQIFNPPGSNAIELYMAAAVAEPGNADVAAELGAVIEQALGMAETALLESRVDDAEAALERVALADPGNARLPFLNAQLSQMQLRSYLDNARAAILDSRFEDAAGAVSAARTLDVADTSAIDAVENELIAARSARQSDEVLSLASARLEEGRLIAPANDNARYYYEMALANDPDSAAARQGLIVVASKLVLSARAEIDGGNFGAAESLLAEAQQLDPASTELAASITALAAARDRVEQDQARAEADRRAREERDRLEREKAEAEARAEAERLARERQEAEAAAAAAANEPQPQMQQAQVQQNRPVAASSLNRTKYVAPKYPRSAERRNLSGYVDVVFTVNVEGKVEDIEIRGSEPGDVFVNSAVKAVERWEFEPVIENGATVRKRAGVRMMFAIE